MNEITKESLESIVKNHEIALIDGNIASSTIDRRLAWNFYDKKDLFALNYEEEEAIKEETEHLNFMTELVNSNESIFTIEEVVRELKAFQEIIGTQYRFNREKLERKINNGARKYGSDKEDIERFMDSLYSFVRTISGRIIRPREETREVYNALFDNVLLFEENFKLRKKSPIRRVRKKEASKEDMHRNANIAASAFYNSLDKKTSVAVISNNTNIIKLVKFSQMYLIAKDLEIPMNSIFRDITIYHPKVYSKLGSFSSSNYKLHFNSDSFTIKNRYNRKKEMKNSVENRLLEADRIMQENCGPVYAEKAQETYDIKPEEIKPCEKPSAGMLSGFYNNIKEKIKQAIKRY